MGQKGGQPFQFGEVRSVGRGFTRGWRPEKVKKRGAPAGSGGTNRFSQASITRPRHYCLASLRLAKVGDARNSA